LLNQAKGCRAGDRPEASLSSQQPESDSANLLGQNDIEKLLADAGSSPPAPASSPHAAAVEADIAPHDIDYLLTQAEQALQSVNTLGEGGMPSAFPPIASKNSRQSRSHGDGHARPGPRRGARREDELGRTQMYLEDVLRLRKGSVVPWTSSPASVDIYVNQRLVPGERCWS